MKITSLIKKLEKLAAKNPKLEIVLASDQEGNEYSVLTEIQYNKTDNFMDLETMEFWQNELDQFEEGSRKLTEVVILYP